MPAQPAAASAPSPHILSCRPWRSVPPMLPPPTKAAGEGMATGAVASMKKFWPWRMGPTGRRWRSTTDWMGGRVTQEARWRVCTWETGWRRLRWCRHGGKAQGGLRDKEEEGAGKRRAIKGGRHNENHVATTRTLNKTRRFMGWYGTREEDRPACAHARRTGEVGGWLFVKRQHRAGALRARLSTTVQMPCGTSWKLQFQKGRTCKDANSILVTPQETHSGDTCV